MNYIDNPCVLYLHIVCNPSVNQSFFSYIYDSLSLLCAVLSIVNMLVLCFLIFSPNYVAIERVLFILVLYVHLTALHISVHNIYTITCLVYILSEEPLLLLIGLFIHNL